MPVTYGPGVEGRVRDAAPRGVVAAFDTSGTDEANDASLALVAERSRIINIAADWHAREGGPVFIGATNPASGPYRERIRSHVIDLAASGALVVPMARTFPFSEARAALALVKGPLPPSGKPGSKGPFTSGKIALVP